MPLAVSARFRLVDRVTRLTTGQFAMRKLIGRGGPLVLTGAFVLSGVLAVPLIAVTQTAERSRTQGLKETDKFVKAGGNTSEAVGTAKLQTQKTLDAYNALVTQPSKNMETVSGAASLVFSAASRRPPTRHHGVG